MDKKNLKKIFWFGEKGWYWCMYICYVGERKQFVICTSMIGKKERWGSHQVWNPSLERGPDRTWDTRGSKCSWWGVQELMPTPNYRGLSPSRLSCRPLDDMGLRLSFYVRSTSPFDMLLRILKGANPLFGYIDEWIKRGTATKRRKNYAGSINNNILYNSTNVHIEISTTR